MTLSVKTQYGVNAYCDTPPAVARDFGAHIGSTSIGQVDYIAGADNCSALTTATPTASNAAMYAVPFVSPSCECGIDRLAFEVTANVAATAAKIGLFEDVDFLNNRGEAFKPGKMLWDSGSIATTSNALMTSSISPVVRLKPNRVYWLVYYVGIEATHATVRALVAAQSRCTGITAVSATMNGGFLSASATPGYENWGHSPELTGNAWSIASAGGMPVMRYRLVA